MTKNLKSEDELKAEALEDLFFARYNFACKNLVNSAKVEHCITEAKTLIELDEWKQCEKTFFNLTGLDRENINSVEDFKKLSEVEQYLSAFKALSTLDKATHCLQSIETFNKLDPEAKRMFKSPEFYTLAPEKQISILGDWFFYCDALMTVHKLDRFKAYEKEHPDIYIPLSILQGCNDVGDTHRKFVEWSLVAGLLTVICKSEKNRNIDEILHIVLRFILEMGKEYLSHGFPS